MPEKGMVWAMAFSFHERDGLGFGLCGCYDNNNEKGFSFWIPQAGEFCTSKVQLCLSLSTCQVWLETAMPALS